MSTTSSTYNKNTRRPFKDSVKGKGIDTRHKRSAGQDNVTIQSVGIPTIGIPTEKFALEVFGVSELYRSADECLNDILPAYNNYIKLAKEKSQINNDGSVAEKLNNILDHLKTISNREHEHCHVDIINEPFENKYMINVWAYHNGAGDIVYGIPLYCLELIKENNYPLYNCLADLLNILYYVIGFQHWKNNDFMMFIPESMLHVADEYAEDNPRKAMELIATSKNLDDPKSNANQILKDVTGRVAQLKQIKMNAWGLKAKRGQKFIKEWMLEGLEILSSKDAKHLKNFQNEAEYGVYDTDYNEGKPVDIDNLFVFTYRMDDGLMDEYLNWIGDHSNEYGCYSACSFLILKKNTTELFKHSKWYTDFITWLNKGITGMEAYIEKYGERLNIEEYDYNS